MTNLQGWSVYQKIKIKNKIKISLDLCISHENHTFWPILVQGKQMFECFYFFPSNVSSIILEGIQYNIQYRHD